MAAQQTSTPSKIPFQPPVARAGNPYRNQWREPPPFPPSWQLAGTGYRPQWYRPQWYPPQWKLNPPTSHQLNYPDGCSAPIHPQDTYPDGCSARQLNYPDGCSAPLHRHVAYPDGWSAPIPYRDRYHDGHSRHYNQHQGQLVRRQYPPPPENTGKTVIVTESAKKSSKECPKEKYCHFVGEPEMNKVFDVISDADYQICWRFPHCAWKKGSRGGSEKYGYYWVRTCKQDGCPVRVRVKAPVEYAALDGHRYIIERHIDATAITPSHGAIVEHCRYGLDHDLYKAVKKAIKSKGGPYKVTTHIIWDELYTRYEEYGLPKMDLRLTSCDGNNVRLKSRVECVIRYERRKLTQQERFNTVDDCVRYMAENALPKLPPKWVPTTDFKNAVELSKALFGVEDADIAYFLPINENIRRELDTLCREHPDFKPLSDEDMKRIASVTVSVSAAVLFNLCRFLAISEPGERVLFADGTFNTKIHGEALVVVGHADSNERGDGKVTTSIRPHAFVKIDTENGIGFSAALVALKRCAKLLFGVDMAIDFGESDVSRAFVNGYRLVYPKVRSVFCWFHVVKTLLRGQQEKAIFHKIRTKKNKHRMRSNLTKVHRCRTDAAAEAALGLLCEAWEELGEGSASDHLVRYYILNGKVSWYYNVIGVPGLYPSGNANESMNKQLKEKITLRAGAHEFYTVSLRTLHRMVLQNYCHTARANPDEIKASTVNNFIATMMDFDKDFVKVPDGKWLANRGAFIGQEICKERIQRYYSAMSGKIDELHLGGDDDIDKEHLLNRLVKCQDQFCELREVPVRSDTDGAEKKNVYCICERFIKKLQCPASVKLRAHLDKLRHLDPNLSGATHSARKRGRPKRARLGGEYFDPSLELLEPSTDLEDRMSSLTDIQLTYVATVLGYYGKALAGETTKIMRERVCHLLSDRKDGKLPDKANTGFWEPTGEDEDDFSIASDTDGMLDVCPATVKTMRASKKQKFAGSKHVMITQHEEDEEEEDAVYFSKSGRPAKPVDLNKRFLEK